MKKAILIVSFGSSNLDAYKLIEEFINNIKLSLREEIFIQCVFTSNILIKRIKEKNNIDVLNINEALNKLSNEGYEEVVLQPLHMIDGKDCDSLREVVELNKCKFNKMNLNQTLLINKGRNTRESALNIVNAIKINVEKEKYVVLVGHGSNRCSDNCCYTSNNGKKCISTASKSCNDDCYLEIEKAFESIGYNKVIIGTLEGNRRKELILKELKNKKINEVEILPLLVLPGNHVIKDIKGENSWESLFDENNIRVKVKLKSLLEYKEIQKLYIDMLKKALFNL